MQDFAGFLPSVAAASAGSKVEQLSPDADAVAMRSMSLRENSENDEVNDIKRTPDCSKGPKEFHHTPSGGPQDWLAAN